VVNKKRLSKQGEAKMETRQLGFLAVSSLVMAAILFAGTAGLSARADAYSVGVNSYTIGSVTANPKYATIGTRVTLTGIGQLPKTNLAIGMGGRTTSGEVYWADLGSSTTDDAGNWSATVTIPATCTRKSDGATVPVFTSSGWPIGGIAIGPDGGQYDSYTYISINADPQETSPTSTSYYNSALPNTGAHVAAILLTGLSIVSFAAVGLKKYKQKKV